MDIVPIVQARYNNTKFLTCLFFFGREDNLEGTLRICCVSMYVATLEIKKSSFLIHTQI